MSPYSVSLPRFELGTSEASPFKPTWPPSWSLLRGHWLFWPRFLVIFHSSSRQVQGYYLTLSTIASFQIRSNYSVTLYSLYTGYVVMEPTKIFPSSLYSSSPRHSSKSSSLFLHHSLVSTCSTYPPSYPGLILLPAPV